MSIDWIIATAIIIAFVSFMCSAWVGMKLEEHKKRDEERDADNARMVLSTLTVLESMFKGHEEDIRKLRKEIDELKSKG